MLKNNRQSVGDRVFNVVNYIYLLMCVVVILFPLLNVVSQSLSAPGEVFGGKVLFFPKGINLDGYRAIISSDEIIGGFANSVFLVVVGTALSVTLTIMAAYPLARKGLFGRGGIMALFTFTMMFSGGLIPTYLLVRSLGLIDNRLALILPHAVGVWNVIIARTFFMNTIPDELYEAAEMDGCSDIRAFFSIVLPLAAPIIAVMTLFYAVGIWNSYFDSLLYITTQSKFPLQIVLRNLLMNSELQSKLLENSIGDQSMALAQAEVLKYAVIVFTSLPMLMLYPFIQKFFVKGIMVGSVKG